MGLLAANIVRRGGGGGNCGIQMDNQNKFTELKKGGGGEWVGTTRSNLDFLFTTIPVSSL